MASLIINRENTIYKCTKRVTDMHNLQVLLIVASVALVYANTLSNGFIYDDWPQILNNSLITSANHISDIFTSNANHAEAGSSNFYRPLMDIIYLITYQVFNGPNAWGFHLVNIIFHVSVSILVFRITSRLFSDAHLKSSGSFFSAPFIATLIFALHPINTEVVAWIACIPELSFTFFCLLSLNFHTKARHNADVNQILAISFFCLALFCKETAVVFLPVLVLYDYLYRRDKFDIRNYAVKYAPFFLVVFSYLCIRLKVLGGLAPSARHPELNTYEVLINTVPLFSKYIRYLLWPANLNAYHILKPVSSAAEPKFIFSLVVVLLFIALCYFSYKKDKVAFIGLIITVITLIPVLYIRGVGENTFAERYLYLPSIGFALTTASFIHNTVINRARTTLPIYLMAISILITYGIEDIHRNRIWHDELSFWSDTVEKSPDSYLAHNNLGLAYNLSWNTDASIVEFKRSINIKPDNIEAHLNLGLSYTRRGDFLPALTEYQNVLKLDPRNKPAQVGLEAVLTLIENKKTN